ncbi:MAG: cytochrome c [Flavobacteriales bacterium]|jgi:mono/diheme cytochrome c family protein|nr:cytochrome c [Flavobacteriales bacterium]
MRKELKTIEIIERYLTNKLSAADKEAFEKMLTKNPNLKKDVDAQREIMETTKRVGLKRSAGKSYKKWRVQRVITKGLIGLMVATAILTLGMYFLNSDFESNIKTPDFNKKYVTTDSISGFSNTQLEKEVYQIISRQDTIIETKDGIVLYIPENAFKTTSEKVSLVIQSAITSEDIILAGLSTTSDGKELETGGMFYVDAYVDGKRVSLAKPLTINVPTENKKSKMKLYRGEKTQNGEINWIEPKKLESFLTPVDILSLDFYPPNYQDSIDSWGSYDKRFKDSLYYSFVNEKKYRLNEESDIAISDSLEYNYQEYGKMLFKNNCAACHRVDKGSTGPMLKGARKQWEVNGEGALIYEWIADPTGLAESGKSKRATEIINYSKSQMPPQSVSKSQIDAILDYVDGVWKPNCVNPATIKTIWSTQFNNTILATKEFEERIPYIHNSCSNEVLEMYINNLDKPLSVIDSMVIPLTTGRVQEKFVEFSMRGDGSVELSSKTAKRLAAYYQRKQRMITKALIQTQTKYWEKQSKENSKMQQKENQSVSRSFENQADVFKKEFEKNLCKVYQEVNYPYDCKYRPIKQKYTVKISDLGWNNIDREVYKNTAARTTTAITYKGKTATLKYDEWSATIKNEKQFDRIFVYNIPVEFNSYIKLHKKNKKYSYKLNADIQYQTIVVGWNEHKIYFAQEQSKKGHTVFELLEKEREEVKHLLRKELGGNQNSRLEAEFVLAAQKDQKRINRNLKKIELKNKIQPIIFPCWERDEVLELDTTAFSEWK